MKPLVTIAAICIILLFLYVGLCTYRVGKALDESFNPPNIPQPLTILTDSIEIIERVPCDSVLVTAYDRVTKVTRIGGMGTITARSLVSDSIKVMIIKQDNVLVMHFNSSAYNYFEDDTYIYLIFEDRSTMKFLSNAEFNMLGEASILFKLPSKKLDQIRSKTIQAISIRDSNDMAEGDLDKYSKARFYKTLDCLFN